MYASSNGHTEAIKALLTVPDINVNHADVSLHLDIGCVPFTNILFSPLRNVLFPPPFYFPTG